MGILTTTQMKAVFFLKAGDAKSVTKISSSKNA
jgi:hypothetical protein